MVGGTVWVRSSFNALSPCGLPYCTVTPEALRTTGVVGVIGCCAGLSSVGSIIRLNHSNFRLWPVTVFTKTRANVITAAISSIAVQVSMGVGSGYSRRWGPEGKYMTQTELRSIADSLKIEIASFGKDLLQLQSSNCRTTTEVAHPSLQV